MDNYRNFIYIEEYKLVFCYIPKVACTNWKCLFRKLMGYEDYLDSSLAHDRKRSGLVYLNELPGYQDLLVDSGIAKCAFIRDPYTRVLSAYLNKFDRLNLAPSKLNDDYFSKIYKIIRESSNSPNGKISFLDFLKWLKEARSQKSFAHNDEHWRDQVDILQLNNVQFDFIGAFEKLEDDSNQLFKLINVEVDFPSQKDVKFPPTQASSKVFTHYCENAASLVQDIYESDFKGLGIYKVRNDIFTQ